MPYVQYIAPTGDIRLLQSHLSVGNMRGSNVAFKAEVLSSSAHTHCFGVTYGFSCNTGPLQHC